MRHWVRGKLLFTVGPILSAIIVSVPYTSVSNSLNLIFEMETIGLLRRQGGVGQNFVFSAIEFTLIHIVDIQDECAVAPYTQGTGLWQTFSVDLEFPYYTAFGLQNDSRAK